MGEARRICHLLTDEDTSILSSPRALGTADLQTIRNVLQEGFREYRQTPGNGSRYLSVTKAGPTRRPLPQSVDRRADSTPIGALMR